MLPCFGNNEVLGVLNIKRRGYPIDLSSIYFTKYMNAMEYLKETMQLFLRHPLDFIFSCLYNTLSSYCFLPVFLPLLVHKHSTNGHQILQRNNEL